jgi:hypothetical protein
MYIVNLIRERSCENEQWVDTFEVEDRVTDPEMALRIAVECFLATLEGKKMIEYTGNDFNWGDAIMSVPEKVWNHFGLRLKMVKSVDIKVNQDEVLCKEEEQENE